uniref:Uncharacterized protein LOC100374910 n=1 Tax=Saccoglossus kowalevskii TaxID=10224 RepID=A0ABM0GK08_SACKO|nr:PREDICTED: uncharacterized protein LOC100374910 [Saccoglossus kowalevskii]
MNFIRALMAVAMVWLNVFAEDLLEANEAGDEACDTTTNVCFKFFHESREEWNVARDICDDDGGQLLVIDSFPLHKKIRQYINSHPSIKSPVGNGYWTGANDIQEEGVFQINDCTPLTYRDGWHSEKRGKKRITQPSNTVKQDINGQDCVQIWERPQKNAVWKFDDDYCWKRKSFICEYKALQCEIGFYEHEGECKPTVSYFVTFIFTAVNGETVTFSDVYVDPTSNEYLTLLELVSGWMNSILESTDLYGVEILGFYPGSIGVDTVINFDQTTATTMNNVQETLTTSAAAGPLAIIQSTIVVTDERVPWRVDGRCGSIFRGTNGVSPAECDPYSTTPCCSSSRLCGISPDHCDCDGCIDYRDVYGVTLAPIITTTIPTPIPTTESVQITSGSKLVVDSSSDVAIRTHIPELREVTACLWIQTKGTNQGTPISYATSGGFNEFILFDTTDLKVYVRQNNGDNSGIAVNDNDWHHLCVTWSSAGGLWDIFDNGALAASGSDLRSGYVIREGGVMTLGQEQDRLRGGYDPNQALKGELAYFNMWSRILSDDEIGQLAAECNGETEGDLFAWSLADLDLDGSYETLPADICIQWTGTEKLIVDTSSDVAIITPIPELRELTACLWIKTKETNQGTPISYATSGGFNEFILFDTTDLKVYVRQNNGDNSGIAVNDNDWHHLCVTWSSTGGLWDIFDNGVLAASGSDLRSGYVIREGGVMTLGQEQDSIRGGYDPNQALKGELAYFNMWSRILTDNEIGKLAAECNGETEGDLFAWSSGDIDLDGSYETLPADICLQWTGTEKLIVDSSSDVAIRTPIPELSELTACLWIKTKETNQGTPISYATSGGFNEFILFDTTDLKVYVRQNNGDNSGIAVNDNDWHHLCVTWSSAGGLWDIFDNGVLAASGSGLRNDYVIRGGGVMTLGQEQDSLRGTYDPNQALKGEIAYFNMWSRILTDVEIGQLAAECDGETEGDLFAWSSADIDLDGTLEKLPSDVCH